MRKDVRLGLAVGGILFGVVLVYVLFFAGGKGEDQYSIDDASSESTENTTSAGGMNTGTSSGGASVRPHDNGTTLVETGPVSNTVTPQAPAGNTGNAGARNHAVVQGNVPAGNRPTTRPVGSPIASGFNAPAASAGGASFNWRQLMEEGDLSGQLLSRTVTPTPGGGREEHRIIMDPPLSSGGTNAEPRTGDLTAAATGPRVYTVKSGDSFWSIAKTEYGNSSYYGHLVRANPKVDPAKLKAGMRITIPSAAEVIPTNAPANALTPTPVAIDETRQYRVSKGDNLSSIAKKLYGRADMADKIYELNRDVIGPNPSALKLNAILTLPEARVAGAGGVN